MLRLDLPSKPQRPPSCAFLIRWPGQTGSRPLLYRHKESQNLVPRGLALVIGPAREEKLKLKSPGQKEAELWGTVDESNDCLV
jgi:hypothetical protein